MNASVRENILFGRPYDPDRFAAAVEASCLGPDISILPNGLDTEIGEKGMILRSLKDNIIYVLLTISIAFIFCP
jgi:ABC-type multidrug transport system fused ATPase/permease subunit